MSPAEGTGAERPDEAAEAAEQLPQPQQQEDAGASEAAEAQQDDEGEGAEAGPSSTHSWPRLVAHGPERRTSILSAFPDAGRPAPALKPPTVSPLTLPASFVVSQMSCTARMARAPAALICGEMEEKSIFLVERQGGIARNPSGGELKTMKGGLVQRAAMLPPATVSWPRRGRAGPGCASLPACGVPSRGPAAGRAQPSGLQAGLADGAPRGGCPSCRGCPQLGQPAAIAHQQLGPQRHACALLCPPSYFIATHPSICVTESHPASQLILPLVV